MKLRDIVLGGMLITGTALIGSCAFNERSPETIEQLKRHPRHFGISSVISSGPYEGFYCVGIDYGDSKLLRIVRSPKIAGEEFAFLEVMVDINNPSGFVLKKEGNVEYYPNTIRKMSGFYK